MEPKGPIGPVKLMGPKEPKESLGPMESLEPMESLGVVFAEVPPNSSSTDKKLVVSAHGVVVKIAAEFADAVIGT